MEIKTTIRKATPSEARLNEGVYLEVNDAIRGSAHCRQWNKLAESFGFAFMELKDGMLVGWNPA